MIELPPGEVIEDVVEGDAEHWLFKSFKGIRFCYIKPLKPILKPKHGVKPKEEPWDGQSNLQLVTKDGKSWLFNLVEVTDGDFDSKVVVSEPEPSKAVSACDTGLREELSIFKEASLVRQASLTSQVEGLQNEVSRRVVPVEFLASLDDGYRIPAKMRGDPFNVRKIYIHDNVDTYVVSKTPKADFFERYGKKTTGIDPVYQNGVYIINRVIKDGCMSVGVSTACFKKKEPVKKESGQ